MPQTDHKGFRYIYRGARAPLKVNPPILPITSSLSHRSCLQTRALRLYSIVVGLRLTGTGRAHSVDTPLDSRAMPCCRPADLPALERGPKSWSPTIKGCRHCIRSPRNPITILLPNLLGFAVCVCLLLREPHDQRLNFRDWIPSRALGHEARPYRKPLFN